MKITDAEMRLREAASKAREHAQHGRPNGVDDEMRKLVRETAQRCAEIVENRALGGGFNRKTLVAAIRREFGL